MAGISGVSGAGPIFHRTMLALHEEKEASFPKQPASLASISVDERTGHHFPIPPESSTPWHKKELCPREYLPLPVSSQDYDPQNRALLSRQFAEWFQSADNVKSHAFALTDSKPVTRQSLQFLTPLPGATYYLDPELPGTTNQLQLTSNLPDVTWSSETLTIKNDKATLIPGTHQIHLSHSKSKQNITCKIRVEEL